jgi:hypothetical protein
MTEIFRYKSGGEDMIVLKHDDGKITRNSCRIGFTKTGRKYVELMYSQRHQYLCKYTDCFKNTYKQGSCRDHQNIV